MTQRKLVALTDEEDPESGFDWGFGSISCMEALSYCIAAAQPGLQPAFFDFMKCFSYSIFD